MKYFVFIFLISQFLNAQKFEGYWKTVDEDGIAKSIVEIYKTPDGKIEGKVHKILKESARDRKCIKCEGDKHNKPIEGLTIIEDLKPDGNVCKDGEITDPENGKTYDCKIWIEEDNQNTLNVRGYWVFFYRTQQWKRVEVE